MRCLFCRIQLTGRKPLPAAYPHQLRALGDHLRKRQLDLGLLQRKVAEKLGVDKMTACNWETNRTSPQLRCIPRIIAFLGSVPDHTQVESLGQQIVAPRRRLGLSQRKLARRLGVDPTTLSSWERETTAIEATHVKDRDILCNPSRRRFLSRRISVLRFSLVSSSS